MNEHIDLIPEATPQWIYPVYVPSYTRAGVAPLLNLFAECPGVVRRKVTIIVREEEREAYRAAYPWASLRVVNLPGLGPARMRALRAADLREQERLVMLDDDIKQLCLLSKTTNERGERYAQRYSKSISGMSAAEVLWRTLAVACKITDGVFALRPDASYGAARNALFSGPVADPDVAAQIYKQSFPSCVMFFNLRRFAPRRLPKPFHFYGEDLAIFLENMKQGQVSFQMPCIAYDQGTTLKTTIPLDPSSPVGRRVDMDNAAVHYPELYPYLRESVRNKAGGVVRIGINWQKYNKETGHTQTELALTDVLAASTKES